jgi:hypothetical protein
VRYGDLQQLPDRQTLHVNKNRMNPLNAGTLHNVLHNFAQSAEAVVLLSTTADGSWVLGCSGCKSTLTPQGDRCLCPQQMQLQSSAELEMAEFAVGVLTVSSLHKFNLVFLALRD